MDGDSPFAEPQSSYERPVPLILVDPDVSPDVNVCFRSEWMPYVIGALQQLVQQTTWKTKDPDALNLQQARAQMLISLFITGCPPVVPLADCTAYSMNASFISYYPQNPYTQPLFVPDWYDGPPFIEIDSELSATVTGTQIGDIYISPGAFPHPTLIVEKGLSAIHIEFTGAGIVELHLIKVVAGGEVIVTIDDDGLNSRVVDTNADILEAPPETPGEVIEEFTITGTGAHHMDIRFTPILDDSGIPLRYGGGMRSVVLCGPTVT